MDVGASSRSKSFLPYRHAAPWHIIDCSVRMHASLFAQPDFVPVPFQSIIFRCVQLLCSTPQREKTFCLFIHFLKFFLFLNKVFKCLRATVWGIWSLSGHALALFISGFFLIILSFFSLLFSWGFLPEAAETEELLKANPQLKEANQSNPKQLEAAEATSKMCYKVVCPKCQKFTYGGCGNHIESALAGVPQSERCTCSKGGK